MDTRFMFWWLVVVIQLILAGIALNYGAFNFLLENDKTYLSFVIISMWATATLLAGYANLKKEDFSDSIWFIAESAMTVGMVGTVIGFMLMLGSSFSQIDPSNVDSMKQVIADMATGMSTALLTTLCGLVVSLLLKIQVMISETVR